MGVLSSEFKDELDIRYKHECGVIATSVFTDKPVSMKYRGVFKLHERCVGKLHYIQDAGIRGNLDDIFKRFCEKNTVMSRERNKYGKIQDSGSAVI